MISRIVRCPAPAKLNLYLHVTGRRADGMHLLDTVFELIDLADEIDLSRRDDGHIVLHDPLPGVPPEADLVVRAARALAAASRCGLGVELRVRKRIPIGGGLGGGSSDAATTLLALNRLWDLNWAPARLAALAPALGADVAAFVFGRASHARGIGERLRPIALPARHYVLVAPPVGVPTAAIFQAPELTRNSKPIRISGLSRGSSTLAGRNDLEPVACGRHPEVAKALEALRRAATDLDPEAARSARMSGSGACVFLPARDEKTAQAIRARVAPLGVGEVRLVRTLVRHPLRDWSFSRVDDVARHRRHTGSRQQLGSRQAG